MLTENIAHLQLIESPERGFPQAAMQYAGNAGLFTLRGCTRHVALGTEEAMRPFLSHINTSNCNLYTGKEAYSHLLQYVTGQFSKTRGESQIVSQFKRAYDTLSEQHPEKAQELQYLYQSLLADNAMIRTHVTHDLRPAFYESTAHGLSNQRAGDTVLLVGDLTQNQQPTEVTKNISKQLANKRKDRVGRLLVTHPDDLTARTLATQLKRLKLATEPEYIAFSQALDNGLCEHRVRHTYVTLPMDKHPRADQALIDSAGEWETFNTNLVHFGGNAKSERITRGHWRNADLELGIMPETISEAQQFDKDRNAELVAAGKRAATNCATSRTQGKAPILRYIQSPPETYAHLTGSRSTSPHQR